MIFVSHATPDDKFVNRLADEIAIRGFATWVDHLDMPAGSRWVKHLEQALNDCEVMILICSQDSMNSSYVEAEWHTYFDMKKPVIPLRIDDCKLPPFLRTLHQIDFRHTSQFDKQIEALIEILGIADAKTVASRPITEQEIDLQPLKSEDQIFEHVNYLLDEIAPTFRTGIMQLILPSEDLILSYPLIDELVVGRKSRAQNNHAIINLATTTYGSMISRQHAVLPYRNSQLYVEDLASTNGTYIKGVQLDANKEYPIDNYGLVYFSERIPVVIRYLP